jgi:hypothetical protein
MVKYKLKSKTYTTEECGICSLKMALLWSKHLGENFKYELVQKVVDKFTCVRLLRGRRITSEAEL